MLNDENFLKIAFEISKGSRCVSKKVGALIVKDTRILSTGYNGTPSGYINCDDKFESTYTKEHHDWSYKYEIHAEMNAIVWAARNGISIEWATMYVMLEPCLQCTKNTLAAGIKRIVYANKYPHIDSDLATDFINENWIEIVHLDLWEEYAFQKTFKRN